jgi:Rrf2 family protein
MVTNISQKNRYALRAVCELARQGAEELVKTAHIAEAQAIPPRFLEVILGQLRRGGLVKAKRGQSGGYALTRSPETITVGDVFRLVDSSAEPVACSECAARRRCPLRDRCVYRTLWQRTQKAVLGVLDSTTIQDLIHCRSSQIPLSRTETRDNKGRGCRT